MYTQGDINVTYRGYIHLEKKIHFMIHVPIVYSIMCLSHDPRNNLTKNVQRVTRPSLYNVILYSILKYRLSKLFPCNFLGIKSSVNLYDLIIWPLALVEMEAIIDLQEQYLRQRLTTNPLENTMVLHAETYNISTTCQITW